MLIVSQDRKTIINFNNICRIDVNDWKENCFTIDCFDVSDFECMLGRYETEERAKEVLKEIADRYEILELARYSSRYELVYGAHTYSYEMPLE